MEYKVDTPQGKQAINLARPNSVEELASLNAILRLMASERGAEQPLEKYARFKQNPWAWEEEMTKHGLTQDEKTLLHSYLDYSYGICGMQEDIMMMIQDPQLGGWSLAASDRLRKSIAKKDKKLYEDLTAEYFKTVEEKNLSKRLCEYFWNVLVATQRGYSFNLSHTLAYSIIALQEMTLACKYPIIFWNTANLIVDSSGIDSGEEDDEEDGEIAEGEQEKEEEERETDEIVSIFEPEDYENYEYIDLPDRSGKVKRARKTVNYGRTAAAIGKFQKGGIKVSLPNINKSNFTFTPDVENNSITYGLRGITRLPSEMINLIIERRPFTSFKDFSTKIKVNKLQATNLIKCGAFDEVEKRPREEIMKDYIESITETKNRLTLQNMPSLIAHDLIPEDLMFFKKLFLFNRFLKTCKDDLYYQLNDSAVNFIMHNFDADIILDGVKVSQKVWDNIYKKAMEPMKAYLKKNMSSVLKELNHQLFMENWNKYAEGNNAKYEMDSVGFYSGAHELDYSTWEFENFYNLPEEPIVESTFLTKDGYEVKMYKLSLIAGTVLDKNKMKSTVTLLTQYGVVTVKVYKNQFSGFDKQISAKNAEGEKKVLEKSWFKRGNLLMIQGIRRGDNFIPKKYKSSIYPVITKIEQIHEDGNLEFKFAREEVEE